MESPPPRGLLTELRRDKGDAHTDGSVGKLMGGVVHPGQGRERQEGTPGPAILAIAHLPSRTRRRTQAARRTIVDPPHEGGRIETEAGIATTRALPRSDTPDDMAARRHPSAPARAGRSPMHRPSP